MREVRIVFKRGRSDLMSIGSIKCDPDRLDKLKSGETVRFDATGITGDLVLMLKALDGGVTPGQIFTSGVPRRIPAGGSVTLQVRKNPNTSKFKFGIVPLEQVLKDWAGGGGDATGSGPGT